MLDKKVRQGPMVKVPLEPRGDSGEGARLGWLKDEGARL